MTDLLTQLAAVIESEPKDRKLADFVERHRDALIPALRGDGSLLEEGQRLCRELQRDGDAFLATLGRCYYGGTGGVQWEAYHDKHRTVTGTLEQCVAQLRAWRGGGVPDATPAELTRAR